MPERVRLSRRRGYRKPAWAVVVARPTKWGNPFHAADFPPKHQPLDGFHVLRRDREQRRQAVAAFEAELLVALFDDDGANDDRFRIIAESLDELRGKDLACWCPLDGPCHADVLLRFANR